MMPAGLIELYFLSWYIFGFDGVAVAAAIMILLRMITHARE